MSKKDEQKLTNNDTKYINFNKPERARGIEKRALEKMRKKKF